eukprot:SAG11_NODE_615_length_8197_cov_4.551426_3_plen_179_part_00
MEPHEHASRQLIISGYVIGYNQRIRMLCDSGASVDFCAPEVYERLNPKPELQPSKIEIGLGNGDIQKSSESFTMKVVLQSIPLRRSVTAHTRSPTRNSSFVSIHSAAIQPLRSERPAPVGQPVGAGPSLRGCREGVGSNPTPASHPLGVLVQFLKNISRGIADGDSVCAACCNNKQCN